MHPTRFILAAALALILSGCASQKGPPTTQFDFGPATPASAQAPAQGTLGPVVVTDVTGSSALDNERMFYRLSYADPLQARTYANSRWTANPLQLLTQRFKTRLAQAGARVLSETDASIGIPLLRIDVDEFIQDFGGVSQSTGVVAVRASVFQGHTLVDQRSFRRAVPASGADAPGGARALAAGTDAVAADIVAWLGTLDINRR
jgi:cholesterol transport system auxiliary component